LALSFERKALIVIVVLALSMLVLRRPTIVEPPDERTYTYRSSVVYSNRGGQEIILDESLRVFSLFANTSWQTIQLMTANRPYTRILDPDDNPAIRLEAPSVPPGDNITLSYTLRIVTQGREPPNLNVQNAGNFSDIPQAFIADYCEAEGSWPVENETLRTLASEIWDGRGGPTNTLLTVTAFADWIGLYVRPGNHDIPWYPNETYDAREGDCDDQANLLITLCRILDIPAYLQVGGLERPGSAHGEYWESHISSSLKGIVYHGWAVIYVPPWGWLPFDMTLAWSDADPLSVVTSAPAWSVNTLQLLNITESDWAGEGKRQRDMLVSSDLYVYSEDELIAQGQSDVRTGLLERSSVFTMIRASPICIYRRRGVNKVFTG
jgi:hypothetical protein